MPRYIMDMDEFCKDIDFTHKNWVLDMIQHDTWPILKYVGIIAHKALMGYEE